MYLRTYYPFLIQVNHVSSENGPNIAMFNVYWWISLIGTILVEGHPRTKLPYMTNYFQIWPAILTIRFFSFLKYICKNSPSPWLLYFKTDQNNLNNLGAILSSADFFQNQYFVEKFFQVYHQSVKHFGFRSGLTFCFCWDWSWSKLFAKVISWQH